MKKSKVLMLLATSAMLFSGCQSSNGSKTPSSISKIIGSEVSSSISQVSSSKSTSENSSSSSKTTSSSFSSSSSSSSSSSIDYSKIGVTNLAYSKGIISFDPVGDADSYLLVITKASKEVLTKTLTSNSYRLENIYGDISISVTPTFKGVSGKKETINAHIAYIDEDVILEAEDALLNPKHYSIDGKAHGGAYGLAFDDCGQGMYFRYYAYEAGKRTIDVAYATASVGSYMTMFVNYDASYRVEYTENTNWFGDAGKTAIATVENVTLVQGWNEIVLIKNGTSSDSPSYGGWAQVDYIKVHGSGKEVDIDSFNKNSDSYHLEAEMAEWHYQNTNQRPVNWGNAFSLNFGLGEINADGDGCKFNFKVAETGKYALKIALGGPGNIKLNLSVNNATANEINVTTGPAWNLVSLTDAIEVNLTAGVDSSIDIIRNDNWFTLDYITLTRIYE